MQGQRRRRGPADKGIGVAQAAADQLEMPRLPGGRRTQRLDQVDTDERRRIVGQAAGQLLAEAGGPLDNPQGVRPLKGRIDRSAAGLRFCRRLRAKHLAHRRLGLARETIQQLMRRLHANGQVRMSEQIDQPRSVELRQIGRCRGAGQIGDCTAGGLRSRAAVNDAPDPASLAVAAGMGQRHFVMADDPVVEIGDVEGPVGPELDVDGPEPVDRRIQTKSGCSIALRRRAVPLDPVVVDAVGDHVADEHRAAIGLGELVGRVISDAGDAGASRDRGSTISGPKPRPSSGLPKLGYQRPRRSW